MITNKQDRCNFIGGSEANMIYMNYSTASFRQWWKNKLEGVNEDSFQNLSMAVGTILEHDVIDLYESLHNIKGERERCEIKGIARANTDYIHDNKVSDVKVSKKAFEWFLNEKVSIQYKRQLIHYCYVFGLERASIIAYQACPEILNNPFIELDKNKLYEIEVPVTKKAIQEHKERLDYLEFCKETSQYPN